MGALPSGVRIAEPRFCAFCPQTTVCICKSPVSWRFRVPRRLVLFLVQGWPWLLHWALYGSTGGRVSSCTMSTRVCGTTCGPTLCSAFNGIDVPRTAATIHRRPRSMRATLPHVRRALLQWETACACGQARGIAALLGRLDTIRRAGWALAGAAPSPPPAGLSKGCGRCPTPRAREETHMNLSPIFRADLVCGVTLCAHDALLRQRRLARHALRAAAGFIR
jgi:hypothetical protein